MRVPDCGYSRSYSLDFHEFNVINCKWKMMLVDNGMHLEISDCLLLHLCHIFGYCRPKALTGRSVRHIPGLANVYD